MFAISTHLQPQHGSAPDAGAIAQAVREAGPRRAWLCDLDGTLVDSMALHHRAYARLMAELGGELIRAAFDAAVGPPARVTIPLFAAAAGLDPATLPEIVELHARKKVLLSEVMQVSAPVQLATARLIADAPPELRIAVVTSGNRHGAEAILRSIGLFERVELLVSGDDVTRGKPDPEPYASACALLGLAPAECLAFEDHPDGIRSALAAGVDVVDVAAGRLEQAGS